MGMHALAFDDEYEQMDAWFRAKGPEDDAPGSVLGLSDAELTLDGPAFHALIADAKFALASRLGVPSGDIVIIVRA